MQKDLRLQTNRQVVHRMICALNRALASTTVRVRGRVWPQDPKENATQRYGLTGCARQSSTPGRCLQVAKKAADLSRAETSSDSVGGRDSLRPTEVPLLLLRRLIVSLWTSIWNFRKCNHYSRRSLTHSKRGNGCPSFTVGPRFRYWAHDICVFLSCNGR